METGPIRILIADDHPVLRKGLRLTIEEDPGLRVVAEASDGEEALALISKLRPDIAVLDIDMPKLDGLGVAREARRLGLAVKTIFLTLHMDEEMFRTALELGSKGYILEDSAALEIVGWNTFRGRRPALLQLSYRDADAGSPRNPAQNIHRNPRRPTLSHRTAHHAIDRQWQVKQGDRFGAFHSLPHGRESPYQYMP